MRSGAGQGRLLSAPQERRRHLEEVFEREAWGLSAIEDGALQLGREIADFDESAGVRGGEPLARLHAAAQLMRAAKSVHEAQVDARRLGRRALRREHQGAPTSALEARRQDEPDGSAVLHGALAGGEPAAQLVESEVALRVGVDDEVKRGAAHLNASEPNHRVLLPAREGGEVIAHELLEWRRGHAAQEVVAIGSGAELQGRGDVVA